MKTDESTPKTEKKSALAAIGKYFADIYEVGGGKKSRLEAMEGLRGFAILFVFLSHYQNIILGHLPIGGSLKKLGLGMMEFGGTGVDLFFVLSGMLIYRAVLKPNLNFKKFLARRVERIYPTFLALFVVYVVMNVALLIGPHRAAPYDSRIPSEPVAAIGYLLANLAFLPGLFPIQPLMNVAWSLSYEWFFYLTLPIAVTLTGLAFRNWRSRISVFFSVAVIFWGASLLFPDVFFMRSNPVRASHIGIIMFLGGMIISDLLDAGKTNIPEWFDWVALAVGIGALCVPFVFGYDGFRLVPASPDTVRKEALMGGALFAGYGLVVYCALAGRGVVNRICRFTPLRWLGNISYSFYLVHGLPMHMIASAAKRAPIASFSTTELIVFVLALLPVTFVIVTAVSTALFAFVEKPFSLTVHKPTSKTEVALQQAAP